MSDYGKRWEAIAGIRQHLRMISSRIRTADVQVASEDWEEVDRQVRALLREWSALEDGR